ncbi:MAG: HD domain-containing protein [Fusobacterium sp.]|nr:HD domain-containing protein [Fusobacterium sp.]
MKNKENGVSLFSQSEFLIDDNPMEELFALNLGDFLSEHLISSDLVEKIGSHDKNKRSRLIEQIKELTSIYSSNKTLSLLSIASKEEENAIYDSIAASIAQMLEIKACKIYLSKEFAKFNSNRKYLTVGKYGRFTVEKDMVKDVFANGKIAKCKSSVFVPMKNNLQNIGVILLANDKPVAKEYVALTETIARLFATSMALQAEMDHSEALIADEFSSERELQNVRGELTALIGDLCDYQQEFVERLAAAVDMKGQYKVAHSQNTAELARLICRQLKLNEKTTDLIYYAGLLQNIGKIAVSEKLFNTKGKLSAKELKKIQTHSNVGVHFLMNINFLSEVVPYITYRTERVDGSGEPEGLKGQSIPLGSRIIAAADAFSALTSDRPFRKAMAVDKALSIMKEEVGKKWDVVVVNALAESVKAG